MGFKYAEFSADLLLLVRAQAVRRRSGTGFMSPGEHLFSADLVLGEVNLRWRGVGLSRSQLVQGRCGQAVL